MVKSTKPVAPTDLALVDRAWLAPLRRIVLVACGRERTRMVETRPLAAGLPRAVRPRAAAAEEAARVPDAVDPAAARPDKLAATAHADVLCYRQIFALQKMENGGRRPI